MTELPPDPSDSWLSRVLRHAGWGLWCMVAGLAYLSRATFLIRCDGFSCTFMGMVWMALAGLWVLAVLVALGVRAWQRRRSLPTRLSSAALLALLVAGGGHGLYWLWTVLR